MAHANRKTRLRPTPNSTSNTKLPLSESEPMPFQDVQVIENVSRSQDLQRFVQPGNGSLSNAVLPGQLRGIQEQIEKALAPEIGRPIGGIPPEPGLSTLDVATTVHSVGP